VVRTCYQQNGDNVLVSQIVSLAVSAING
jgi:hypothetical protein